MVEYWQPSEEARAELFERARDLAGSGSVDTALFHLYFDKKHGAYSGRPNVWYVDSGGRVHRQRRRITRRQWIETYFVIRDRRDRLHPMILNPMQRDIEAMILRTERARLPVRLIVLKARQQGISTYSQALEFEMALRNQQVRTIIVTDKDERSESLLSIAHTALNNMPKGTSSKWKFRLENRARDTIAFADPINSRMEVTSAEAKEPGRGSKFTAVHQSERAFWKDPKKVQRALGEALPRLERTYLLDESTANGDVGDFRDAFWDAWEQRDKPLLQLSGFMQVYFAPWFQNPEYRWSESTNRPLPKEMAEEIAKTLDAEEKMLLTRRYWQRWRHDMAWERVDVDAGEELSIVDGKIEKRRTRPSRVQKWRRVGIGWKFVDFDQLAWRRAAIRGAPYNGDLTYFNQEMPSSPEVAFAASGRPVFDPIAIRDAISRARAPIFIGSVDAVAGEQADGPHDVELREHELGGLRIWARPEDDAQYVIGIDTAGGGPTSDYATATVIDAKSCAVVAVWSERKEPKLWGEMCSRLGWLYNDALLAFETQPSMHGLAALQSAIHYGYANIYTKSSQEQFGRPATTTVGWSTNSTTKPLMFDRVKTALRELTDIPDEKTLFELKAFRWITKTNPATGVMKDEEVGGRHDDRFVALAVALCARDEAWREGKFTVAPEGPKTVDERFWEHWRAQLEGPKKHSRGRRSMFGRRN